MIKVLKGRFDYFSGMDGLIALPNLNPYWKHYRHSTAFRHSQNYFENTYGESEKIFLYAGLNDGWAYPMPNLLTEKGLLIFFVLIWRANSKRMSSRLIMWRRMEMINLHLQYIVPICIVVWQSNMLEPIIFNHI